MINPEIQVIQASKDTGIASIQIQDGTGKIINPFNVDSSKWSVTPDFIAFGFTSDPIFKDVERKIICPAHTEPVTATVTIEAQIDILDGRGLQPYWLKTVIQFNAVAPAAMIMKWTEA